ncbi:hypothetical protein BO82DRAFT_94116 [Aspergillus uvarum CBS 121591]|uniref:Uncharacterized protein n=1 Tax=Aspergillus uvarum CBS 121591 TaxID=1448315 RepID=A0A319D0H6_9EURO|nr:hypothetical protein BO82DRAFT_94116 [Aspergillus uvarum CBS 121591]PYH81368.1 hypothetical protein BO82DRAFT_94116 [Aspergillus uvarum CBS 121591]
MILFLLPGSSFIQPVKCNPNTMIEIVDRSVAGPKACPVGTHLVGMQFGLTGEWLFWSRHSTKGYLWKIHRGSKATILVNLTVGGCKQWQR